MKLSKIRTIVAAVVFCVLAICLVAGINMGTLSGFGWDAFSALCPLGAFTTMLATKTMVPRAVFSIIIMALLVFVFGRAFCGWICPVPVLDKVRAFFRSPKKRKQLEQAKHDEMLDIAKFELGCGGKGATAVAAAPASSSARSWTRAITCWAARCYPRPSSASRCSAWCVPLA